MNIRNISAIFLLFFYLSTAAGAESFEGSLKNKYIKVKENIVRDDAKQRLVMGKIYGLNSRIKKMSRKRGVISDRMMSAKSNARSIARDINDLGRRIEQQRNLLSVRLRSIYKMGMNGELQIMFSSANSHNFDKNLKFLKILSNKDFELIKDLNQNLKGRTAQERRLKEQVKKLVRLKHNFKKQERLLESEQKTKSSLLSRLRKQKVKNFKTLKGIKKQAIQNLLDDSFFVFICELAKPVDGVLIKGYSLIQDEQFKYSIAHKGHFYRVEPGSPVKAVYSGEISFMGDIPGYGKSVVLDHGDHYYTVYANLEKFIVEPGVNVSTGDSIAYSGESVTGMGIGLYFEVRHFSDAIDPNPWLKTNNTALLE